MAVDVLFTGGAVFTGTGSPLMGVAVGITDGRSSVIAPEAEAEKLVGDTTQRVDLLSLIHI